MALTSFFGRDPVFGARSLMDPFDLLVASSDLPSVFTEETRAVAATNVDWKETPDAHVIKADLPGLKKNQVNLKLEEGNILCISGERPREELKDNERLHRAERSIGRFLRRFRLPDNTKSDEVKAQVEDGVLTVTVPKIAPQKTETRSIDIA